MNDGLGSNPQSQGFGLGEVSLEAPYRLLNPPIVSGVSGVVTQGNTVTLAGEFSHHRNGQLLYADGSEAVGIIPAWLSDMSGVPTNGSAFEDSAYKVNSEQSFSKNGKSLKATFPSGEQTGVAAGAVFRLPERSQELFVSCEVYPDLSSWDGTNVGPQIKFLRLLSQNGQHNGDPAFQFQLSSFDTRTTKAFSVQGFGVGDSTVFPYDPDGPDDKRWGRNLVADEISNKWNRYVLWAKVPSSELATDGKALAKVIEHHTDRQIGLNDTTYTNGDSVSNPRTSWKAPAVKSFPTAHQSPEKWFLNVIFPFYQLGIYDLKVWMDCLYVNDTPERVEIGNAPIMDDCGKLVIQKQLSRTGVEIQFQLEEGNFLPADNLYAFVVNSDGEYTTGTLIRAGV